MRCKTVDSFPDQSKLQNGDVTSNVWKDSKQDLQLSEGTVHFQGQT